MAIRVGILGAAAIAPNVIINPARENPDFEIVAVGARNPDRAKAYAAENGIPHVSKDYDALVHRDDIDLIYNALPAGSHAAWSIAALEAGKHVLCEKPFAMNAAQARRMNEAAGKSGRKLVEAFHYRHHNVMKRMVEIVRSGELGKISSASGDFTYPVPYREDQFIWIREQGGGVLMDMGCYPMHALRTLMESEPKILGATCTMEHGIDATTRADMDFRGVPATLYCSMKAERMDIKLRLIGEKGSLEVTGYTIPQWGCTFNVTVGGVTRAEPTDGPATYVAQLAELGDVLLRGKPQLITNADSLANMVAIDAVFAAAGVNREFD